METKCIKLVPPCYTMSGEWYDAEQRCYAQEHRSTEDKHDTGAPQYLKQA